eukprot:7126174-Pyramimonas_sp.AAC.1
MAERPHPLHVGHPQMTGTLPLGGRGRVPRSQEWWPLREGPPCVGVVSAIRGGGTGWRVLFPQDCNNPPPLAESVSEVWDWCERLILQRARVWG